MPKKYLIILIILSVIIGPQKFLLAQATSPAEIGKEGDDFFYTPLSGFEMPQGPSLGDALKSMVVSTILNSILGVVSREVPTRGKDVTSAITQTFSENFKQQLALIKNDIKKMINESGDYIMQKIFERVLQKVTRALAKLQIKDPELYKSLNAYGGIITGITMYTQKSCIDPAIMECVANSIRSVLSVNNPRLGSKNERGLQLSADAIIKNLRPCPQSAIAPESNNMPDESELLEVSNQKSSRLSFNNIFKKVPFFADVLKTQSANNKPRIAKNLAQVNPSESSPINELPEDFSTAAPIGSFINEGLQRNLTALMCQDAISGLISMASTEAAKRLAQAEEEAKIGFKSQQSCLKKEGDICIEPGPIGTPAPVIGATGEKMGVIELESLTARMNDPKGVNVVASWLRSWTRSKIDNILSKGFSEAADITSGQNTAMADIGKNTNIEKACADMTSIGGSGLGAELRKACEDAYRSQVKVGAAFDRSQANEVRLLGGKVLANLAKLQAEFRQITEPDTFTEIINRGNDLISSEFISEQETLLREWLDTNSTIQGLITRIGGFSETDIASILQEIDRINDSNSVDSQQIQRLKEEIDILAQSINEKKTNFQNQMNLLNQTVMTSRLSELFFEKVTQVVIPFSGNVMPVQTPSNSIVFYKDLNISDNALDPAWALSDLVYYLNQDLAPDKQNLKTYGFLQSSLNDLSEIFDDSHIPTSAEITKIAGLKNYFSIRKQSFEKLTEFFTLKNWLQGSIYLNSPDAGNTSAQNVIIEPFLAQVNQIVSQSAKLFTDIDKFNILSKLQQLKTKEQDLSNLSKTQQAKIDTAYNNLIQKLSSGDLDFSAKESELAAIDDEINSLRPSITFLKSRVDDFSNRLNSAIQNIPEQQTPATEEPQSQAPIKSKIGLMEKTFAVINIPFKLIKNLFSNILELINAKRFKLK